MAISGRQEPGRIGLGLLVHDVPAAVEFYCSVLGAETLSSEEVAVSKDCQCAELRLAGTYIVVQREIPQWRAAPREDWPRSPLSSGAASAIFTICVDDVDQVFKRALERGATPPLPGAAPEPNFWGDKVIQIHDPFGHVWRIQTVIETIPFEEAAARLDG